MECGSRGNWFLLLRPLNRSMFRAREGSTKNVRVVLKARAERGGARRRRSPGKYSSCLQTSGPAGCYPRLRRRRLRADVSEQRTQLWEQEGATLAYLQTASPALHCVYLQSLSLPIAHHIGFHGQTSPRLYPPCLAT